jgi:hypothetical protein
MIGVPMGPPADGVGALSSSLSLHVPPGIAKPAANDAVATSTEQMPTICANSVIFFDSSSSLSSFGMGFSLTSRLKLPLGAAAAKDSVLRILRRACCARQKKHEKFCFYIPRNKSFFSIIML